jgi:glucosamine--fructose-6-phosphate aminotransferase (isomerizing)
MCGIIAYTGIQPAIPILLNGLKRLEYRGYDSAGVTVALDNELFVEKTAGKVNDLGTLLGEFESNPDLSAATCGIAHTRWATHGPATTANAHPHCGPNQRISLVHNGIIENYRALQAQLSVNPNQLASETDTEIIAHLIEATYEGDLLEAVTNALQKVQGTFGIACVSRDEPGVLVVARRGSPIVIGLGMDETFVASDASAIVKHTRQAIFLDDNDVARIQGSEIEIRSLTSLTVSRSTSEIEGAADAADKGGFPHYMLKEIFDQPEAVGNSIRGRMDRDRGTAILSGLNVTARDMADLQRLLIVGCGTSMNAGLVGEYAVEDFAGLPVEVEQAAEFRYRNPIVGSRDLVLAISQSGETADTLAAVREAVDKGALVAGLVNVVGSTIARETARGIFLHAGPEISVASTKAFTCQVSVLLMIALKIARSRRMSRDRGIQFVDEIESIPGLLEDVIAQNDRIAIVAERFAQFDNILFMGRGYMYPVALEGALKLKEVSYIHAEGYHAAELKHGPIALLEENVPVIALLNDGPGKDKMLGNVAECRARNAPVLGVVTRGDREVEGEVDAILELPPAPQYTAVVPAAAALQLFAYHVARLRGCPIDQPRNLAKSVTVE